MRSIFSSHGLVPVIAVFWVLAVRLAPMAAAYELSTAEMSMDRHSGELSLEGDWVESGIIVNCTRPPADGGWNVRFQFPGSSFSIFGAFATFDKNGSYTLTDYGVAEIRTAGVDTVTRLNMVRDDPSHPDLLTWSLDGHLPYGYHDVMLYNVQFIRNALMQALVPAPPDSRVGFSDLDKRELIPNGTVISTEHIKVEGDFQTHEYYEIMEDGTLDTKPSFHSVGLSKGAELVITPPKETCMVALLGLAAGNLTYPLALDPRMKWTSSNPLPFLPADENTAGIYNTTLRSVGFSTDVVYLALMLNPLDTNQTTLTITGDSDDTYFNLTSVLFITPTNPAGRIVRYDHGAPFSTTDLPTYTPTMLPTSSASLTTTTTANASLTSTAVPTNNTMEAVNPGSGASSLLSGGTVAGQVVRGVLAVALFAVL